MVAAPTAAFAPAERPRVAVASDGTLAAITEPARVVLVEVPGCAPFAEVGIDPDASATDVAWVGAPPRLLVLSRYAAHSTAHLLDPYGPRSIAEIRLETPMKLCASVGAHALAVGSLGAAVLAATDAHLTPYQFPARAVPGAAGVAGAQFVVSLSGSIEEWDPLTRMPKRRLKLPRPAVIAALGGSDRVVWYTTQTDPTRVDVIPLVNRGQPKYHELPEPIAHVASHPRSDLLACIGADRGRIYVVDLDGRAAARTLDVPTIDRADAIGLVVGRLVGALVAQARRPIAVVALDGRDMPREREDKPSDPPAPAPAPSITSVPVPVPVPVPAPAPAPAPVPSITSVPAPTRTTWRDDLASWARAIASGSPADHAPPTQSIADLAARFDVASLTPALALLYGAHLAGSPGAAPLDVARVLRGRWDEALGRGQLAARGLTTHRDSRVRLAPVIERALDELPPRAGTIVGELGATALLGPCVVVDDGQLLTAIAERVLAAVGGAILAAHADADPRELLVEARARGAIAMLRWHPDVATGETAIFVVSTEAAADQLAMPRLR